VFLQRIIQAGKFSATTAALTLAFFPVGFCQTASVQDDELPPPDQIEEIVVYGEKSMVRLRLELHRAEENFFTVFNSLNTKKEFDVECQYVVPVGSRRRQHACTPRFAKTLQAQAAGDMVIANMQYSSTPLGSRLKQKEKLMWKEIGELIAEQPEMQKAYVNLIKANRGMDAERQRRCEDRGILCNK